jgi:hypothetical protein
VRTRAASAHLWIGLAGVALASLATATCGASRAEWTVLGYLSGDGSLEPVALEYMRRLAAAPGSDRVSIGVQIDRGPGFSTDLGDFEDTRRVVFEGSDPHAPRRWKWANWRAEVDMGDPRTLGEFLAWGVRALPAEKYVVLLVGHGSGVRPFLPQADGRDKGVAYDATNDGDSLTPKEIATAGRGLVEATGGKRVTLLAVDACFSASLEMAYEAAAFADVMSGSPDLLYEPGVPWDQVLRSMCETPGMTGEQVAAEAVEAVRKVQGASGNPRGSYAAAWLGGMAEFGTALSALSSELRQSMAQAAPAVTGARGCASQGGLSGEMLDVSVFLQELSERASGVGRSGELAAEAKRRLDAMVVAAYGGEGGNGPGRAWTWAVFFPPSLTVFPADYLATSTFARETGWGALLEAYLGRVQRLLAPAATGQAASSN